MCSPLRRWGSGMPRCPDGSWNTASKRASRRASSSRRCPRRRPSSPSPRWPRRCSAGSSAAGASHFVVIYAVAGETAIFVATTLFIDRPRPSVPRLDEAPPTSSFPSGHTAAAVCFYGSIAAIILWHSRHRWITVAAVVICAAVPLLIAGSRVYRGMHYPTDVLAGHAARRDLADRRRLLRAHP